MPMKRNFLLCNSNFQNDEEWRIFYCDSTPGWRVIQDFDFYKLDDSACDVTMWCKIAKN